MFYVYDTTRKDAKGMTMVAAWETTREVIAHLEDLCPKLLGKTRSELMNDALDFGYGDDDSEGRGFYMMMSEYVECGVIAKDGTPTRCNIFTSTEFSGPEYGH
jgi:hypothetical protein